MNAIRRCFKSMRAHRRCRSRVRNVRTGRVIGMIGPPRRPASANSVRWQFPGHISVDGEQAPHHVGLAGTREATFGRHTEFWNVFARKCDPLLGAFDTVGNVNEAEIDFRSWRQLEVAHRLEEFVRCARQGNRKMDVSDRVPHRTGNGVGDVDEMPGGDWIEEMLAAEIAVAKMKAQRDIVGNGSADARDARGNLALRRIDQRKLVLRLPVPDDHVVADVPLNAEVRVRNMTADRRDLVHHRRFISRLDRGDITRGAEGVDHTHRGWQTNLKADTGRNDSMIARRDEIEIGRARLTGIAELAEAYVLRCNILRQAQQRKARRLAECAARVGPQERTGAQERILEAHPQATWARLAVRNPSQPAAERRADGTENLLDAVQSDAADQMNAIGHIRGLRHFGSPLSVMKILMQCPQQARNLDAGSSRASRFRSPHHYAARSLAN